MSVLRQRLDGGEVIILYRAMDTEFEKHGVLMDETVWYASDREPESIPRKSGHDDE